MHNLKQNGVANVCYGAFPCYVIKLGMAKPPEKAKNVFTTINVTKKQKDKFWITFSQEGLHKDLCFCHFQILCQMSRVIRECWNQNPKARLTALRLKKTLKKLLESLEEEKSEKLIKNKLIENMSV